MKKIGRIVGIITAISSLVAVFTFVKERKNNSFINHKPYGVYEKYIKRPLDAFLSTGALIVLSPVLLVVGILVKLKLGSPVIFTQERPGKDEKIFKLYKFRTMTNERDENGNLLPDEDRLTSFGKWLRGSSLDELPELVNIIKGDMAVVGPRPLLVEYLDRYSEEQRHRHDVRPGLTGYAQVNGRNSLSWEDKFEMDVLYTKNIGIISDASIIIDTVKIIISKRGVSSKTSETMEAFLGNDERVHVE